MEKPLVRIANLQDRSDRIGGGRFTRKRAPLHHGFGWGYETSGTETVVNKIVQKKKNRGKRGSQERVQSERQRGKT